MTERTTFVGGQFIEGQGDAVAEVAPEPVDGFPSAWHKERYVEDLKRELADLERKLTAVGLPEWIRAQNEAHKAAVLGEIDRLTE